MNRARSFFVSIALNATVASTMLAGCGSGSPTEEEAAASTDEGLTAAAWPLVGEYVAATPNQSIQALELRATGLYRAEVVAPPGTECLHAPCTIVETGRWRAYAAGGLASHDGWVMFWSLGAGALVYRSRWSTDGGPLTLAGPGGQSILVPRGGAFLGGAG